MRCPPWFPSVVIAACVSLSVPLAAQDATDGAGDSAQGLGTEAGSGTDTPVTVGAAGWLPADTLAMGRISNVSAFLEQWDASSFGAQMDDPAFAEFFDSVARRFSGINDGLGIGIIELIQRVDGEVSFAAVPDTEIGVSLVAVAEFADSEAAEGFIGDLTAELRREKADPTVMQTDSATLHSWRRDRQRTFSNLNYFVSDQAVIFSDRLQTLAETANRGTGNGGNTLADNADFRHVMDRVIAGGNPSGANWYADPSGVVNAAVSAGMGTIAGAGQAAVENQLTDMVSALGLDQVRGLGGSFWLGQGGVDSVSTTYGYIETPVEGLLQALKLPATSQRPPDWVKDDVSIYAQMNWGVDQLLDAVERAVDQRQGEGSFDKMIGSTQVGQGEWSYGDLADRLIGPVHVAAEIPQGAQELTRQRALFGLGIRDAAEFGELIDELARNGGAEVSEVDGSRVYEYEAELPLAFAGLPAPSLAVTVTDDAILFSPNGAYLRETLKSQATKRPLADSPDYQQVAAQFPERTSMISYQRQDSRLEGLYEQLRSGLLEAGALPGLTGQMFNFDFSKLPPFPEMSRYLQTTGSFIVPQEDGFRMVSFALPPREQ